MIYKPQTPQILTLPITPPSQNLRPCTETLHPTLNLISDIGDGTKMISFLCWQLSACTFKKYVNKQAEVFPLLLDSMSLLLPYFNAFHSSFFFPSLHTSGAQAGSCHGNKQQSQHCCVSMCKGRRADRGSAGHAVGAATLQLSPTPPCPLLPAVLWLNTADLLWQIKIPQSQPPLYLLYPRLQYHSWEERACGNWSVNIR